MPNARICLPSSTALESIFPFVKELDGFVQHDRLIIDLPKGVFFSPFVMLLLGSKISYIRRKCPGLSVIFNGWENHSYASHMGFFDMCGYKHGNHMGEAWNRERYISITRLTRNELLEEDFDKFREVQDLIQRSADRISEIISRDATRRSSFFNSLSFSIREVFRNVFEHGETDELYFSAQYWPKSDKVEFAVADHGVGVRRALGRNPNFRFQQDKEALEYSLLPSVSGRTHEPRRSDNWFNSGYGLYMTSRLARNGGSFVIASGDSAICLTPRTKTNFRTSVAGTVLRVSFKVAEIGDVESRLSEFRKDGAEIAKRINGSGNRPPSAMSMLLRRDYQSGPRR